MEWMLVFPLKVQCGSSNLLCDGIWRWVLRRKWQPTPVFLLGESPGLRSLVSYSSWNHKELDTTEQLHFHFPANKRMSLVIWFFKLLATAITDLQHILKGIQGGDHEWSTLCSRKTGKTSVRGVSYFQEKIYEPQFLHLPIYIKSTKAIN